MREPFRDYSRHYGRVNTPPDMALMETRPELFRIRAPWLPGDAQARVLDVGCGWGWLLARLWVSGYRNIQGVDVSRDMCAVARDSLPQEIPIVCADALQHLRGMTHEFDLLTVFDLIEHLSLIHI